MTIFHVTMSLQVYMLALTCCRWDGKIVYDVQYVADDKYFSAIVDF